MHDGHWKEVLDGLSIAVPGDMVAMTLGIDHAVPYWGASVSREGAQLDVPSFVDKAAAGRYRRYTRSGKDRSRGHPRVHCATR